MSELIQEDMSGMALIKIYAQEENERRAFRQKISSYWERIQLAKPETHFPLVEDCVLQLLILLWLGAGLILSP